MRIAYFDCFSGVAGDMIIGAMHDAGLPFSKLKSELAKLGLCGYTLSSKKVTKHGIAASKFSVNAAQKQPERHLQQITAIISKSKLDKDIKDKAISIFTRLAKAEARVHRQKIEDVHFHEVGAVDAIIDICGAVIGLKMLDIDKIYSSPLVLGRGFVQSAHGRLPVPAPATSELIKNIPVKLGDIDFELTTPTGAAILSTLAEFDYPDEFVPARIGYGAGSRDLIDRPNVLRLLIGDTSSAIENDTVTLMETNLDRITGENLGHLIEILMDEGALDVFVTPTIMKKSRPGHLLSVLCEMYKKDKLARLIFKNGKTLGIRISESRRIKLARETVVVSTSGGKVSLKIANLDGERLVFPEYDDMLKAMRKMNCSYDDVYFEIQRAIGKE